MSFAVCNLRAERERLLLLISLAGTHTQTANLSESLCQLARQPGQEKSRRGFNSEKKERKKERAHKQKRERNILSAAANLSKSVILSSANSHPFVSPLLLFSHSHFLACLIVLVAGSAISASASRSLSLSLLSLLIDLIRIDAVINNSNPLPIAAACLYCLYFN